MAVDLSLFTGSRLLYWGGDHDDRNELGGCAEKAEQSDAEVIRQVLDGNTALFELLMRRYNERVYRAARAIVRDEQEAEDVMQQAYVNAFTHLRQFNGAARFSTWLTRIAINEALARVRRQGRYEAFDDELSNVEPFMSRNPSENPERQAFTSELRELLEWAIDTLPDGMREVFVLRDVEGLSTSEVAECLDVSEDVVKTRLSRGRAALRRVLLERTGATAPEAFRFYRPRCDRVVAAGARADCSPAAVTAADSSRCHLSIARHSDHRGLVTGPRERSTMRLIGAASVVFILALAFAISAPATRAEQAVGHGRTRSMLHVTRTARQYSASTRLATNNSGPMCCACTKSSRRSIQQRRWRLASRSMSRRCPRRSSRRFAPVRSI